MPPSATASIVSPDELAARRSWRTYLNADSIAFWSAHLAAVFGVAWLGWSWKGFGVALISYAIRMFFVTAGYHRYFSHRAFDTSRPVQLLLAIGAQTAVQRGVIWWAAQHRKHHKESDGPNDVHSVRYGGFFWAHVGWSTSKTSRHAELDRVKDLMRFPELRFIDRITHLPALIALAILYVVSGPWLAIWAGLVGTVLLWHGTFTINSLSHMLGRQRFETGDDSRNNPFLAVITLGEGWHNNHHHYQSAANQGFYWWEVDVTYYVLRVLAVLRIVWNVRTPPRAILDEGRARDRGLLAPVPPR